MEGKAMSHGSDDLVSQQEASDRDEDTGPFPENDTTSSQQTVDMDVLRTKLGEIEARLSKFEDMPMRESSLQPDSKVLESALELKTNDRSKAKSLASEKQDDPSQGVICESARVKYETIEKSVGSSSRKTNGKPPSASRNANTNEHDMLFASHVSENGATTKVEATIYNRELSELIGSTMAPLLEHENSTIWNKSPVTVSTRNALVIHRWDDLWKAVESADSGTQKARDMLKDYLEHLKVYESDVLQAREKARKEHQIDYMNLWSLFPPGGEVIASPFQNCHQIFTVKRHGPALKDDEFLISCWAYDWDGRNLVRYSYEFKVSKFTGYKNVNDLPCYPIEFYDGDLKELRRRLAERGRKFQQYCVTSETRRALFTCNNFTATLVGPSVRVLGQDLGPSTMTSQSTDQEHAAIAIDPELYTLYAPETFGGLGYRLGQMFPEKRRQCKCSLCSDGGKRNEWEESFVSALNAPGKSSQKSSTMDDVFYSQLPPRVLGFRLDKKQWGQIHIDHIQSESEGEAPMDEKEREKSWEDLSLDETHKVNIEKLVRNHLKRGSDDKNQLRDHIAGKGEGLVVLLHGIPGVGKTMTAESLARFVNRRLLRIDAADFKYADPAQVSLTFKKFFNCAHAWGALLLLDEADVFLQQRKPSGLEQNALVAVLLRELEYFQGVFIMTTNRINTIDNAVQSRIHYSVLFKKLNDESFKKIWKTFEEQLNDHNCEKKEKSKIKKFFKDEAHDLMRKNFTGRDIRNIFTTAQLLSYPWLTLENLKNVLRCTGDFREQLKRITSKRELAAGVDDSDND